MFNDRCAALVKSDLPELRKTYVSPRVLYNYLIKHATTDHSRDSLLYRTKFLRCTNCYRVRSIVDIVNKA